MTGVQTCALPICFINTQVLVLLQSFVNDELLFVVGGSHCTALDMANQQGEDGYKARLACLPSTCLFRCTFTRTQMHAKECRNLLPTSCCPSSLWTHETTSWSSSTYPADVEWLTFVIKLQGSLVYNTYHFLVLFSSGAYALTWSI